MRSIILKKYKPISTKPVKEIGSNLLSIDFESFSSGEKIVGDIAYILHTSKDSWCYLASFMDLYSRKIVGWSYGRTMRYIIGTKSTRTSE